MTQLPTSEFEDTATAHLALPYSDTESDLRELTKENQAAADALSASIAIGHISNILSEERTEDNQTNASAALMVAVEHLGRLALRGKQPALPAFEEFSTRREKLKVTQEALDEITALGKRIFKAIIAAIKKAYAYFAKLFTKQKMAEKDLANATKESAKQASDVKQKSPNGADKVVKIKPVFISRSVSSVLNAGGKVIDGAMLVSAFQQHVKDMQALEYAFALTEKNTIAFMRGALQHVHKGQADFDDFVDSALSEICTSNLAARCGNQKFAGVLEQGFALFEKPLVFANKAYYRTGVVAACDVDVGDIKAFISVQAGLNADLSSIEGEEIHILTMAQIEALSPILRHRTEVVNRVIDNREFAQDALDRFSKELDRLSAAEKYGNTAAHRSKQMYHVLNLYLKYRTGADAAMLGYDQKVRRAILKYIDNSLVVMKRLDASE